MDEIHFLDVNLGGASLKTSVKCLDNPNVKQCNWKKMAARKCPKDKHFQKYCCATCKKINGKYFRFSEFLVF